MKRPQTLLTMALAALLLCCGETTGRAPTETTDRQVSGYGEAPALEEYISTLQQGYRDCVQQGIFFFQGVTPPNEQAYRAIVRNYRESGLETLPTQDRQALLLVAQIAFLSYADTLRYSVAVVENDTDIHDAQAQAVLEEVYSLDQERFLSARRVAGTGVSWPWPVWARQDDESPPEIRQFLNRPVEDPDGSWFVPETVWEKRDDRWSCLKVRIDSMTWAYSAWAYLENFRAFGLGIPLQRDSVGGRPAHRLSGIGAEQQDLTYWLDAETLWLRQYEYEEDGIRYTVKLEAVNEEIRIEPPDVDVPCVEHEPSGEATPAP